jgi:hypothetical protein
MRTTLTLDDDVAALLERVRKERALGLKDAVNEGLRQGLRHLVEPAAPRQPYRTPPISVGRILIDLDDVAEALARAEGETYR